MSIPCLSSVIQAKMFRQLDKEIPRKILILLLRVIIFSIWLIRWIKWRIQSCWWLFDVDSLKPKSVTNISNRSPISQKCHLHQPYPIMKYSNKKAWTLKSIMSFVKLNAIRHQPILLVRSVNGFLISRANRVQSCWDRPGNLRSNYEGHLRRPET